MKMSTKLTPSPSPSTRTTVAKQCRRIAELRGWAYAAGVDGNLRKCNQLDDVADERDAIVEAIEEPHVPALASGVVTLQALGHLDTCRCASLARQRERDDRRNEAARAPRPQVELRVSGGACDVTVVGASSVATATAAVATTTSASSRQRLHKVIRPSAARPAAPVAAPAQAPAAATAPAPATAPTLPPKSLLLLAVESLYQPNVVEAVKIAEQTTTASTFRYPRLVAVAQALAEAGRTGPGHARILRQLQAEILLGMPTLSDCNSFLQAALDAIASARPGAIVESMQEVAEGILIRDRCAAGDMRGQDRYRLLLDAAINKLSFCAYPAGHVGADANLAISTLRLLRDDVLLLRNIARVGGAWSMARAAA